MYKFWCEWAVCAIRSIFLVMFIAANILALSACTNLWKASLQTMQEPLATSLDVSRLTLDPNLSYLKLGVNGQEALLVLGYQTAEEKIWFSSDRAIVKTKNGYLSGMQGFVTNWEVVSGPDLIKFPNLGLPTSYSRVRNVMPGYQYEVRESVLVTPLLSAPSSVPAELPGKPWRWFSEKVTSQYGGHKQVYDYPGLIALDVSKKPYQVMYAQQCLKRDFCLSWQTIIQEKSITAVGNQ